MYVNIQYLQYISHIISLMTKAFLFDNRSETFQADITAVGRIRNFKKHHEIIEKIKSI